MDFIEITDFADLREITNLLQCNLPKKLAFIPKNISTAKDERDFLYEDSTKTLRKLLKKEGLEFEQFEKDCNKSRYLQENAYMEGIALFIGASVITHDPTLINITLNLVSNYLSEGLRGLSESAKMQQRTKIDIVYEGKTKFKRIRYKGPVSGIKDLEAIIQRLHDDD